MSPFWTIWTWMNQMCFSLALFTRLAATIDFLMITPVPQFSTVGTGDVGKGDHSQSLKPRVVKEEWRDESSILRRLTLNFLGLISVPVPKSLQNSFSLTATSRASLVMQTVRVCGFQSFVSP